MKTDLPREIVLKALYKIEKENAYSNLVLDEMINKNRKNLTTIDIGFISELVYGITTYRITLDYIISQYSKTKINKISIFTKNILRMGIYQIIFLNKVPKPAAVNESVNLSKKYAVKSTGFINAILRKVTQEDYKKMDNIKDKKEKLMLKYSMPKWIIEELLKELKIEEVEKICINSNLKPKTTIRVNTIKISEEQLLKIFDEKNIKYEKSQIDNFIYLENLKNISEIEEFKKGYFTVQDLAAGLTSLILNPKEGENVLDSCSAPGGKTTHLAEIMNNNGNILAWDLYESRLNLVNENAKRLGINIIKTETKNATKFDENLVKSFDKILLDVPCLGIGVIRRKPDIKWQRDREDIGKIQKEQLEILENCSKYLKPNGYILYSTCSILKEENEAIIKQFLNKNNNFKIVKIKNEKNSQNTENTEMLRLYPNEKHDGFFICLLQKITNITEIWHLYYKFIKCIDNFLKKV